MGTPYCVDVILEFEHDPRGKDSCIYIRAIQDLRESALGGCRIWYVIDEALSHETNPCIVPHYGYTATCQHGCTHSPVKDGVRRVFGVTIITDGNPGFGTWQVNHSARATLCGHILPETLPDPIERDFVKDSDS